MSYVMLHYLYIFYKLQYDEKKAGILYGYHTWIYFQCQFSRGIHVISITSSTLDSVIFHERIFIRKSTWILCSSMWQ